jgi:hypothetical protein
MSTLVQDLIVSLVALGAVTTIGLRARSMFASKRTGAACGSCTKCPATNSALPAAIAGRGFRPSDLQEKEPRVIRLTVIQ